MKQYNKEHCAYVKQIGRKLIVKIIFWKKKKLETISWACAHTGFYVYKFQTDVCPCLMRLNHQIARHFKKIQTYLQQTQLSMLPFFLIFDF